MRSIVRTLLLAALVAAGVFAVGVAPAQAAVNVGPGDSIQAAINAAAPGTVINVAPGTYRETLLIRKDGIKLRGAGDSDDANGTILAPPANGSNLCGDGPGVFPGICVLAKRLDRNFNVVTPVQNVEVSGFLVHFFPSDGIVSYGASHVLFQDDTSARNGGYGITSFVSNGNVFNQLVARNNEAPGFYIGDSPDASFLLKNSLSVGNQFGILVREANNGTLTDNVFQNNCVGIFVLNHGNDPALDVRVQNWEIEGNQINNNNKACEDDGGGPPFGGVGIALLGPKNVVVENNNIDGNKRIAGSDFGGGVVLVNSFSDGGNAPVGNTIRNNTFGDNKPYDIWYDGTGSGNTFPGNSCDSSNPAYICS